MLGGIKRFSDISVFQGSAICKAPLRHYFLNSALNKMKTNFHEYR
jgi:hypothetical protein